MKGAIAIAAMVCGSALIITQRIMDGGVLGMPSFCQFTGLALCCTGLVMGFALFLSSPK